MPFASEPPQIFTKIPHGDPTSTPQGRAFTPSAHSQPLPEPLPAPFQAKELNSRAQVSPGRTFTPGQGVVPVPVGAVLAGEHGVADQVVARQALEGDGLAHIVAGSSHHSVGKRLRVGAFLQLVGWENTRGMF